MEERVDEFKMLFEERPYTCFNNMNENRNYIVTAFVIIVA